MKLRRRPSFLLAIACCLLWMSSATICALAGQDGKAVAQAGQSTGDVLEEGKFTLHKFEQPIGQETYQIRLDGDTVAAKIDFKFTDRGKDYISNNGKGEALENGETASSGFLHKQLDVTAQQAWLDSHRWLR